MNLYENHLLVKEALVKDLFANLPLGMSVLMSLYVIHRKDIAPNIFLLKDSPTFRLETNEKHQFRDNFLTNLKNLEK